MKYSSFLFVLSSFYILIKIIFLQINIYYYNKSCFKRARYYDSEIGRFISRDTIWQIDDINLYTYVGNNGVRGNGFDGFWYSLEIQIKI